MKPQTVLLTIYFFFHFVIYLYYNYIFALLFDCFLKFLKVDRAIRDIIQPVVERSVTIGVMTTRELIKKDFAMEPDETKMRQAAHLMVSNLSGSLALVTCREPLRQSMVCSKLKN